MNWFSEVQEKFMNFIYSLNVSVVSALAWIALIVTLICATMVISNFLRSEQVAKFGNKVAEKSKEALTNGMYTTKIKSLNYDVVKAYINACGLAYMTNYKMTPTSYILLKFGIALVAMICGLQISLLAGLILLPIGYIGVDFVMNLSDKSDNEKMLADIENVYDVLRIQTKAGVYITSVLTDCYLVVRNKRLKSAFLKLTSDIAAKNDIESALNDFKSKFRNEYIDTLVIIVKQSMQTGQASKMFDDIREQIADIDAAMLIAEKERINRQIITVQLILYFAIIAVAVFITYISLISGLSM
jgi:tight adherence protein C